MSQPFDTIHTWLNRAENIGEETLADIELIQSNPEFAALFTVVRSLVKLTPAAGLVNLLGAGLVTLEQRLAAQQAQQQGQGQPAGQQAEMPVSSDPRQRQAV